MMTSGQHLGPMAGEVAYAISKGAIQQATATLADTLADRGITVNTVNPGPTDTGYAPPDAHAAVTAQMPAGRWGQPRDAANLIGWLCTDEAGLGHRPGDQLGGRFPARMSTSRSPAQAALVVGALGVVFGDIGTSPIYTIQTVFNPGDPHPVTGRAPRASSASSR